MIIESFNETYTQTKKRARNLSSSLISHFHTKGWLGRIDEQADLRFHAGLQLKNDMEYSGLSQLKAVDYMASFGGEGRGPGMALTITQAEARQRVREALDAIGQRRRQMIWDFLLNDKSPVQVIQEEGYRRTYAKPAAMMALWDALDNLVTHYQLTSAAKSKHHQAR